MLETGTWTRQEVLRIMAVGLIASAAPARSLAQTHEPATPGVTLDDLKAAAKIAGLEFRDEEYRQVLVDVAGLGQEYAKLRLAIADSPAPPACVFRVIPEGVSQAVRVQQRAESVTKPPSAEDLAFMSVAELGALLRQRAVTSVELTMLALDRLRTYGDKLQCVATLTDALAMDQARRADAELARGRDRGPLHGIPYGLKDLFATRHYPTGWGAALYRGQRINQNAAAVDMLAQAGAVLVAKLSLGALAMNDVWYGGRTRNPWNHEQGSSGSSAGSCAAVAAGLVPFAIGTETSGSIVSPAHRCRVVGLRPTFGSVSRHGAMVLAWTMDKVGTIARRVEDAGQVLAALLGPDQRDPSCVARGLEYATPKNLRGLRVGVFGQPDARAKDMLELMGATLSEWEPPTPAPGLDNILAVESATAFDAPTREGSIRQVTENEWPAYFRAARFVSAVEYLQTDRARRALAQAYAEAFAQVDVVFAPDSGLAMIYPLNLVGYPQLLVPFGATPEGRERSVSLIGKPLGEAKLLAAGHVIQSRFRFDRLRPDLSKL